MGKNFLWMDENNYKQSIRYFAGNAITNVHLTWHTQRCFKKGAKCYANLPDGISENDILVYNQEFDLWSNWCGNKEPRYMLRFQPKRLIQDVFMNTHNPTITKLLMCNNNVQIGMNGQSILYCTGYQVKSQQKEERHAFEKVSNVLCKVIQRQVRAENDFTFSRKPNSNKIIFQTEAKVTLPEHQQGFCQILAGIYTHTSGHIVGAPMAHYNAMNESRFTFSHDITYLPVYGLEGIINKTNITMQFRNLNGKQVGFNKGMNYLYWPTQMEHMPSLRFYAETEFIKMSEAQKTNIEHFYYTKKHIY
jgi:hypothetical protein